VLDFESYSTWSDSIDQTSLSIRKTKYHFLSITFYHWFIVTMWLLCTVSEILPPLQYTWLSDCDLQMSFNFNMTSRTHSDSHVILIHVLILYNMFYIFHNIRFRNVSNSWLEVTGNGAIWQKNIRLPISVPLQLSLSCTVLEILSLTGQY